MHDYDFFHAFCNLLYESYLVSLVRLPPPSDALFFISVKGILHLPIELIAQMVNNDFFYNFYHLH